MSDFLFSLPTWAVVLIVLVSCALGFFAWCVCAMGGLSDERFERARERRVERVEQRMIAMNHRDVEERRGRIDAWDSIGAEADRVWPENVTPLPQRAPAPVIPIPTDLMDHDGLGAA